MKVDQDLVKCSLILGALFIVFSHPYLYRALHRQFSSVMAFVDMNMCPTEGGVIIHAILFALVIYFGKKLYEKHYGKKKVNKNGFNTVDNEIKGKCKVYCENISNEMKQNNNQVQQNNQQVQQNLPNEAQLQVPLNTIPKVNNNNLANLQNNLPNLANLQNNLPNLPNNNMNNNNMNNNMNNNNMNNNMGNNNHNNMGNNDMNNVSNIMGTQSTEINNLNNQGSLSCGSLPNFTNQLSGGDMFMENTTYVDDMYMRL